MELCRQGMRQIEEARANKHRDFLAFQTAILAGDNVVVRELTAPSSQ
jgi:hypothetical protein